MFANFKSVLESGFSYKKSLEREKVDQKSVDLLREKLKDSKVVPKSLTDKQLLRFLTTYKDDIDQVVVLIENYYQCKIAAPHLFQNRDVFSTEMRNALKNQYYIFLPVLPDNQLLIFHSLKNLDPNTYDYDLATKLYFMLYEAYAYHFGPFNGGVVLYDMKGVSLRFLLKPGVSSLKHVTKFVEEAIPVNINKAIVFNTVKAFDLIIAIIKPFVKTKLFQRVQYYHSDIDFEKFYETQIPKSHLPKEYGGTLGTLDELQEQSIQLYMDMREYFVLEDKQARFEFDDYIKEHPNEVHHND